MGASAIAQGLFRETPEPTLIGGRNRDTGRIVFPCPDDAARWEPIDLPRRGTLWSWTVQRFRPKSPPYIGPEAFTPFAIGYVELPGATIVETQIVGADFDSLTIGMAMDLVTTDFAIATNGDAIRLYAFTPVTEA
ncbi:putative nucleic-acid-binding protein [Sphingobium sp. ba1]|uniref:Zn-ribbon domain-containing OB-fold protein n=1 Tax=Sphingobium sp. ba1 TaxID=1522072 RepID=UPI000502E953|nr:OB-fold domain-containing protein [Sphingobium sp. ba1]KFL47269.1 putative nucleic-acid-binding protein [Sphingobium sp. ba1]